MKKNDDMTIVDAHVMTILFNYVEPLSMRRELFNTVILPHKDKFSKAGWRKIIKLLPKMNSRIKIYFSNGRSGSPSSLRRGDRFSFSEDSFDSNGHCCNKSYQVIRLMQNGKMGDWALLDLITNTIGYTDKNLTSLVEMYYQC